MKELPLAGALIFNVSVNFFIESVLLQIYNVHFLNCMVAVFCLNLNFELRFMDCNINVPF